MQRGERVTFIRDEEEISAVVHRVTRSEIVLESGHRFSAHPDEEGRYWERTDDEPGYIIGRG